MAGQAPKSARQIATEVLNRWNWRRNYAAQVLNKLLFQTEEKQRATDLVFGTTRNRFAIDRVIEEFSGRSIERIQPKLLNILRVAAFELLYCPKTPPYSIVNEAVTNAKAATGKKQTGFINAVLRQITSHLSNRRKQLTQARATNILPQTPLTGCEFDIDFLPDPEASPCDYLSTVFSLPLWLVTDWLGEFGLEKTRQICLASNRRPSVYVRPNSLKITTEELAARFRQADIDSEIEPDTSMIRLKKPQKIGQLPGFADGLFTVQDVTASQAVRILRPRPGWKILDLCAAPGVKTTQLAEAAGDTAAVIATDIDAERLEKVKENTARLDIKNVNVIKYEKLFENSEFSIPSSEFDAVLLDVPCSNTAVLAKRMEVRYRLNPNAIKKISKAQSKLLSTAAEMTKPQGKICYSTCSIQRDENDRLVKDFLLQNPGFELESEKLFLPSAESFDHDGGYVAIMRRK